MAGPRQSGARSGRQALDFGAPAFHDIPGAWFSKSRRHCHLSVDSVDWSHGRRIRVRLSVSDGCSAPPPLVTVAGTDDHLAVHLCARTRRLWRSCPLVKTKEFCAHRAFVCKYDQVSAVPAILIDDFGTGAAGIMVLRFKRWTCRASVAGRPVPKNDGDLRPRAAVLLSAPVVHGASDRDCHWLDCPAARRMAVAKSNR